VAFVLRDEAPAVLMTLLALRSLDQIDLGSHEIKARRLSCASFPTSCEYRRGVIEM